MASWLGDGVGVAALAIMNDVVLKIELHISTHIESRSTLD
jgi:hypothetical protein